MARSQMCFVGFITQRADPPLEETPREASPHYTKFSNAGSYPRSSIPLAGILAVPLRRDSLAWSISKLEMGNFLSVQRLYYCMAGSRTRAACRGEGWLVKAMAAGPHCLLIETALPKGKPR